MPSGNDGSLSSTCARVLAYLQEVYERNPQAEVSAQELQHELELDEGLVRRCIEYLVEEGLAAADLFPRNIWVRLADGAGGGTPPVDW